MKTILLLIIVFITIVFAENDKKYQVRINIDDIENMPKDIQTAFFMEEGIKFLENLNSESEDEQNVLKALKTRTKKTNTDDYFKWKNDRNVKYIPKDKKKIMFGPTFNKKLDDLSDDVENIILGYKFNIPIGKLPENLNSIQFGYNFDQPINQLPKNLKIIQFGYKFNQLVDNLPDSVEKIGFGKKFNQKITKFPNNLKYIDFGKEYNQIIDCQIPDSLTKVKLPKQYKYSIKKLEENNVEIEYY